MAAALFDLQSTGCNNMLTTCTSGKCEWKRQSGNNEYATLLKDLKIVKAEFGKEERESSKPHKFKHGTSGSMSSVSCPSVSP